MKQNRTAYEAIVIGAGVHGLATAYHLLRLGCKRVAILDRFDLGHRHGSSHGKARITRSTYVSPEYVRLAQTAQQEDWPRLEKESGRKLIFHRDGCFFGPESPLFETYSQAVSSAGADVVRISAAEGRKLFPYFRFANSPDILVDRTAGIVAASETLNALSEGVIRAGGEIHANCHVHTIDVDANPLRIESESQEFMSERLVITAGAWVSQLLPSLRSSLKVARQDIGYFELDGLTREAIEWLPPWVYLEEGANNIYYGLPELGDGLLKIGRHLTSLRDDDPDLLDLPVSPDALRDLRDFLARELAVDVGPLRRAEHCLYTNTPNEDFIIDLLPGNERVAIGSACSGHGFKFGPLVGRILAELVMQGHSTCAPFNAMRHQMAFPPDNVQV